MGALDVHGLQYALPGGRVPLDDVSFLVFGSDCRVWDSPEPQFR